MKNLKDVRIIWKSILWFSGMLIALLLANVWYKVIDFNATDEISINQDGRDTIYLKVPEDINSLDSWETTIRQSKKVKDAKNYLGTTFACQIVNDNDFDIKDWNLRLDIVQECYLDSFWCGSFEVHQYRENNENVYLIESQYSDISQMGIDHNVYSDNNLIHLLPGDYLVYIPSVEAKEVAVKKHNSIGIGFIFYYQDEMDLSNWTIMYNNDLHLMDVFWFRVALGLIAIWLVVFILYLAIVSLSKRMQKQMNNRIRNISIMADLYREAYIIDFKADAARLIRGDDGNLAWDLTGGKVQSTLNDLIERRCSNSFKKTLVEFLDLTTVSERLKDSSSITVEYLDEELGWCSLKLFRAGDEANADQFVFTLQDINEEKKKLTEVEARISLAEYKQNVSGSFLEAVSFAVNEISAKIDEAGKAIKEDPANENVEALADSVVLNTRHLNLIQNTMFDLYELECKKLALNIHPYNIHDMLKEVEYILRPHVENKAFLFTFDIDKDIPDLMMGDSDRIEQILVILLFSSILMTEKGFVRFSLYGKQHGDEEELIFSIRDSAQGFTEEQLDEIHGFLNESAVETFDNASLVYLKIINGILKEMNSELKIVSVLDEGSDFYFTLRQKLE